MATTTDAAIGGMEHTTTIIATAAVPTANTVTAKKESTQTLMAYPGCHCY